MTTIARLVGRKSDIFRRAQYNFGQEKIDRTSGANRKPNRMMRGYPINGSNLSRRPRKNVFGKCFESY